MKDYTVNVIALATLIALTIILGWTVFHRSQQALQEGRCLRCGQMLPTNGGDE
ncbi:MAG: hypothetical protein IKW38_00285 [Kiritimatiellae bacterium]|nr:hypothetical protein [Kiritimatiellia bacterium]